MSEYKVRKPAGYGGDLFQVRSLHPMESAHYHHELELNIVLQGRGVYLLPDRSFRLLPGDLLLLPPGQAHMLLPNMNLPFDSESVGLDAAQEYSGHRRGKQPAGHEASLRMWVAVFDSAVVQPLRTMLSNEFSGNSAAAACLQLLNSGDGQMAHSDKDQFQLLLRLCDDIAEKKGPAYVARSALSHLLMCGLEVLRHSDSQSHTILSPSVAAFITHARASVERGVSLEVPDICNKVGVSHSHLCRLCAREMGISPKRYLDLQRFRLYRRLIDSDQKSDVQAAGLRAGFRNYHHLYRVCKRESGKAPRR